MLLTFHVSVCIVGSYVFFSNLPIRTAGKSVVLLSAFRNKARFESHLFQFMITMAKLFVQSWKLFQGKTDRTKSHLNVFNGVVFNTANLTSKSRLFCDLALQPLVTNGFTSYLPMLKCRGDRPLSSSGDSFNTLICSKTTS